MYRVKVRANDGTFQPVRIMFRDRAGRTEGVVPMWTFTNAPFNLQNGEEIIVEVSALMSKNGWGNYLRVNRQSEATVFMPPAGVKAFRAESVTSSSVRLAWEQFPTGRKATDYWVMKSNGPTDAWTKIAATHGLDYTVTDLADARNYMFTLRANNVCGYIESHPLTVQTGRSAPASNAGAISATEGCNAQIMWPTNDLTETSDVEIKNNMGIFEKVAMCGQWGASSCSFHMSTLKNAPFNLAEGTVFEGRVRTCAAGMCSEWAALANSNKLRSIPPMSSDRVNSEQLEWINQYSAPVNSVELSWFNFAQNYFHSGDITFRLDVCMGAIDCTANSENWKQIAMTTGSTHTVEWVEGQDNYKFRVTACNGCGCSKSCTPLVVRRVRVPHACECPKVDTKQCLYVNNLETTPAMVTLTWKRPSNDGGDPISAYKAEVRGIDNVWNDVTAFCPKPDLTRIVSCSFQQKMLVPFGITAGIEVQARVSSMNMAGWSHPSPVCANQVLAHKTPTNMPVPVITQMLHGSAKVCYKAHHQATMYTFSWKSATNARESRTIASAVDSCELIPSLAPGIEYTICVRANTSCKETCTTFTPAHPLPAPVCSAEACDPIAISCTCADRSAASYQVQVKKAASDVWVIFPGCGATGGWEMNCSISHAWLATNTGHAEGEAVEMRAVAGNRMGWGSWSKSFTSRYVSKPLENLALSLSEDTRTVSWQDCGAHGCKYDVHIVSPILKTHFNNVFEQVSGLTHTLPVSHPEFTYKFDVIAKNQCGGGKIGCFIHNPAPLFTQSCPMKVEMKNPVDDCIRIPGSKKLQSVHLECIDMSNNWMVMDSCTLTPGQNDCAINEGDFMNKSGHKAGHNIVCKSVATYYDGEKVESRKTSWNIVVHQPFHMNPPTMTDSEIAGAITVSWVSKDPQIELHCKAPGQAVFSPVNTFGLNNYLMHATCDQPYGCMLIRKNICYLNPTITDATIFTPKCPPVWKPTCTMEPRCEANTLETNKINYVRVMCSSPPMGVSIESFKFEIQTGLKYADNSPVWAEHKCGNSYNAPTCMIPMTNLAMHPFMIADNAMIKGRVTATPPKSTGLAAETSECSSPMENSQPPNEMGLTIKDQTSDEATICWSSAFQVQGDNDKVHLFWSLSSTAKGSTNKADYLNGGESLDVTAQQCHTITLKDGETSFLTVATNGCAERRSTITISLTDCPTCHHKGVEGWHHGEGKALANSNAAVVTASVIGASSDRVGTEECQVPRSAEKPVVVLNEDLSATIAWESYPLKSAALGYTYEVAWDNGEYWVDSPRQHVVRVDKSPYVWSGLDPLVTYRFAVRVVNDCGAGPFSESNFVVVP